MLPSLQGDNDTLRPTSWSFDGILRFIDRTASAPLSLNKDRTCYATGRTAKFVSYVVTRNELSSASQRVRARRQRRAGISNLSARQASGKASPGYVQRFGTGANSSSVAVPGRAYT